MLSHYRNGADHVGWHRDNSKNLGQYPIYCFSKFWRIQNISVQTLRGQDAHHLDGTNPWQFAGNES